VLSRTTRRDLVVVSSKDLHTSRRSPNPAPSAVAGRRPGRRRVGRPAHFVAVSQRERCEFGIDAERTFALDWVGGRFSFIRDRLSMISPSARTLRRAVAACARSTRTSRGAVRAQTPLSWACRRLERHFLARAPTRPPYSHTGPLPAYLRSGDGEQRQVGDTRRSPVVPDARWLGGTGTTAARLHQLLHQGTSGCPATSWPSPSPPRGGPPHTSARQLLAKPALASPQREEVAAAGAPGLVRTRDAREPPQQHAPGRRLTPQRWATRGPLRAQVLSQGDLGHRPLRPWGWSWARSSRANRPRPRGAGEPPRPRRSTTPGTGSAASAGAAPGREGPHYDRRDPHRLPRARGRSRRRRS